MGTLTDKEFVVHQRPWSRVRSLLVAVLVATLSLGLALLGPAAVAAPIPVAYDQTYRPQFHFSPAKNWMNDPNGLLYYKGQYHLFFQYNPFGNQWGNMSWGHAVSTDLVHWKQLPVAIPADDNELVFSGSAVVDKNNTSGFGTMKNPPIVAIYTSAYKNKPIQAQSLAYSTDGGTTFTKYAGNPVLDIGSGEFRDPKVFWYAPAKQWRMVVVKSTEHKVSIYGSPNLKSWKHLSDFGPAGAVGGVWECPDLFPMAVDGNPAKVRWVMVVNLNPGGIAGGSGGQYFVGDFDGTSFTSDDPASYTPPTGTVLQDFESTTFTPWTTTGNAFGSGPTAGNAPDQSGVSGFLGSKLANSFHGHDAGTGTLTSPEFTITKGYLNFLVGGGNHPHVAGTSLTSTPPSGTVFDDFEGTTWGTGWTATGDFTNAAPVAGAIGDQQPVSGYLGTKLVNTFLDHDQSTGTITSPTFTISSDYIDLLVGGGNHPYTDPAAATAVNLVVGGNVVATSTGQDNEALNWVAWNTTSLKGQQAQIQIVDNNTGGWGHINVDNIVFSPEAAVPVSIETAVNLIVNGTVARTSTGPNSEQLDWANWDVRDLVGQQATIQVVDNNTGGWGHILVDQFTAADAPALSATERAHWLDYGRDFYAGVTFNNVPNGKRIMIAWMNNWDYGGNIPTDPWRSAMSVPRILHLKTISGKPRLTFAPVQSLASLRKPQPFRATRTHLLPGTTTLHGPGSSGDTLNIVAKFRAQDAEKFGLRVRVGNGQHTTIGYDVHRGGIYVDRTKSGNVAFSSTFPSVEFAPLKLQGGMVTLRVLVDRSSVEVFANDGRVTITDQIFPDRDSQAVQLFSTGGRAQLQEITIWHLKSIWQ
jgi:fructan beta-fructosidase